MLGKCRDPDGTTMVPPANLFQKGRAPYCALQLVWLNLLTPRSKGKHFYPRFFPPRLSLWGGRQTWTFDNYENKDGLTQDMALNQGMLVMACYYQYFFSKKVLLWYHKLWKFPGSPCQLILGNCLMEIEALPSTLSSSTHHFSKWNPKLAPVSSQLRSGSLSGSEW